MIRTRNRWLTAAALALAASAPRAQCPLSVQAEFLEVAGPFQGGSCSTDPVVPTGIDGWTVANLRYEDCPSFPGEVEFANGEARMWGPALGGNSGGYNGLYRLVPEAPEQYVLLTEVFVTSVQDPQNRPVPSCYVGAFNPVLFPDDEEFVGWQAEAGQLLALRTSGQSFPTGYEMAVGTWHVVELRNSRSGSELRAWPRGAPRPAEAMANGPSLGAADKIVFRGPNWKAYDFSIGRVDLRAATWISQDFDAELGSFTGGSCSTDGVTGTGLADWTVTNLRFEDCPSDPGDVEISGGVARLSSVGLPGNSGGYNGFYTPVPERPRAWQLTTDVYITTVEDPVNRPVPNCFVRYANPVLFPQEKLSKGYVAMPGQMLGLRDGPNTHATGYQLSTGGWHTIELRSTDTGSELRAWPTGGTRPEQAQATGAPLGRATRVLFQGPNWKGYDFSVGRAELTALHYEVDGKADAASAVQTGLVLGPGDRLRGCADGLVNWTSPGGTFDTADGQPNAFYASMWLPSAERSALIGAVGSGLTKLGVAYDGTAGVGPVSLGINDDFHGDNQGGFDVYLQVTESPSPFPGIDIGPPGSVTPPGLHRRVTGSDTVGLDETGPAPGTSPAVQLSVVRDEDGQQRLELDADARRAGAVWQLLVSAAGSLPRAALGGLEVPLALDETLVESWNRPLLGVLDHGGRASLALPVVDTPLYGTVLLRDARFGEVLAISEPFALPTLD